jgi:hypothetical protein
VTDGVKEATRSDVRVLARKSGLSLLGVVLGTLLQFVAFLIVARGLSTGEGGVFFQSVALFMIVSSCTVLGADAAMVRQVAARRATRRTQDIPSTLVAGPVKLLDTAKATTCPSGWKPVTWNQKGQPGTPGTPGTPVAAGVSGYTTVTVSVSEPNGNLLPAEADCPTGKVPLGGAPLPSRHRHGGRPSRMRPCTRGIWRTTWLAADGKYGCSRRTTTTPSARASR